MRRDEIAQLLPVIFQRALTPANPLTAALSVMEALQAPSEQVLAHLDTFFDPRRTKEEFVPYLAFWTDLTKLIDDSDNKEDGAYLRANFPSGLGRLRELTANAAYLSQWRGTQKGLSLFLQTATGMTDFHIQENVDIKGQSKPFHMTVRAPAEAKQYARLIERIIESEKPAYVTYQLAFGSQ
jgi:phage tail-like protein